MRVWETEGTQLNVRAHKGSGQQMAGQTGAQPLSDSKVDRPSPATFHTTKRPPPFSNPDREMLAGLLAAGPRGYATGTRWSGARLRTLPVKPGC
jgi:hypothetical protein